jgi:hypothetical protein
MGYLNTLHVQHGFVRVNEMEKVSHEAPACECSPCCESGHLASAILGVNTAFRRLFLK